MVVPSLLWPKEEQIAVLANTQSTLPIIRYRRRGGRRWASYERWSGNKVGGDQPAFLITLEWVTFVSKCSRNLHTWHIYSRHPTVASVMEHFLASPPPRGSSVMVPKAREAIPLFFVGLLIVEHGLLLPRDDKVRRRFHDHKGSQNSNAALRRNHRPILPIDSDNKSGGSCCMHSFMNPHPASKLETH